MDAYTNSLPVASSYSCNGSSTLLRSTYLSTVGIGMYMNSGWCGGWAIIRGFMIILLTGMVIQRLGAGLRAATIAAREAQHVAMHTWFTRVRFACFYEEWEYKQWLRSIVDAHRALVEGPFLKRLAEVVGLPHFSNHLYSVRIWSHWAEGLDSECHNRSAKGRGYVSAKNNSKLSIYLPPSTIIVL